MANRSILTIAFGVLLMGGITLFAAPTREEAEAAKYSKQLKSSSAKEKANALKELGRLGAINADLTKDSISDIMKALDDKDSSVRAAAAHAIGLVDPPNKSEVVSKLVNMLKEEKEDSVKGGAAMGLGAMGRDAKDAVPALRDAREKAGKKDVNARVYQGALMSITGKKK